MVSVACGTCATVTKAVTRVLLYLYYALLVVVPIKYSMKKSVSKQKNYTITMAIECGMALNIAYPL